MPWLQPIQHRPDAQRKLQHHQRLVRGTTGTPAPAVTVTGNALCPDQPNTVPTDCTVGALTQTACNPVPNVACNSTYGGTTTNLTPPTGGTTLLDDANATIADTCRRNNNAAYASNRFTYPETSWPNGTTSLASNFYSRRVNDASCGIIPRTVQIPQYYNTTPAVQYCNLQRTGVGYNDDAWRGFGRAGVCKIKNDLTTHKFPLYRPIQRVGVVNDGRTFPYTDISGNSGTRTYDQEMTNYANWWTYYGRASSPPRRRRRSRSTSSTTRSASAST